MTTIGYGNQAPVTEGGRAMVFTVGFVSILVFAGALAYSGYIISTILDDCFTRISLRFLTWAWVAVVYWGIIYYSWMIAIAGYYDRWRYKRLNDTDFNFADGYWFAYISTTTVGLGDYYLDPEVLTSDDLIAWPLLFLVGFCFLSAFLGRLSELLSVPLKWHTRIMENLKKMSERGKEIAEKRMTERMSRSRRKDEEPSEFEDAHQEMPDHSNNPEEAGDDEKKVQENLQGSFYFE
jgi:hypothetical protein